MTFVEYFAVNEEAFTSIKIYILDLRARVLAIETILKPYTVFFAVESGAAASIDGCYECCDMDEATIRGLEKEKRSLLQQIEAGEHLIRNRDRLLSRSTSSAEERLSELE